jgi:hypothetical protein
VALLALAVAAGADAGCGPRPTPAEEIRATLAAAEQAVREHDLRALKDRIADDYRDAAGRSKADLESILTVHFLRNPRIHVLVRIRDLTIDAKGRATVEALVATAGRPLPALEALAGVQADLHWVDLGLARRDGEWAVTQATWERARLEDLL